MTDVNLQREVLSHVFSGLSFCYSVSSSLQSMHCTTLIFQKIYVYCDYVFHIVFLPNPLQLDSITLISAFCSHFYDRVSFKLYVKCRGWRAMLFSSMISK